MNPAPLTVYVAASYKHMHAVRLLYAALRRLCPMTNILDWTAHATPPEGLTAVERRAWMDTDHGGQVYRFCRDACASADLVIYLGASGQDAGVEVGLAHGAGVEVIGLAGPLESPGLMLHGAISEWAKDTEGLLCMVRERIEGKMSVEGYSCPSCELWGCDGFNGLRNTGAAPWA